MKYIAIFASGSGTNAESLMKHFQNHPRIRVGLVVTNSKDAGVIERAKKHGVPVEVISNRDLRDESLMLKKVPPSKYDLIFLAGFMRIIPPFLTRAYAGKMLNIHPSTDSSDDGLKGSEINPKVIDERREYHGSRVHYVTDEVDRGATLVWKKTPVDRSWSPQQLELEIKLIEHTLGPKAVEMHFERLG